MSKLFNCMTFGEKFNLSEETAKFRASIVEDCKYDVCLAILKGDCFYGTIKITFNLKEVPTKSLGLDFVGQKISSLTINQTLVENKDGDAQKIFTDATVFLQPQYLKKGPNEISMQILTKYTNTGEGLHSFTDETDGLQYLYTQFEVNFCHQVFPCFDQPDIKATW